MVRPFFVTTGFHGLHVTIGTIFLIFCYYRAARDLPFFKSRISSLKRDKAKEGVAIWSPLTPIVSRLQSFKFYQTLLSVFSIIHTHIVYFYRLYGPKKSKPLP